MKLDKRLDELRMKTFQNQRMGYTMLKVKFHALGDWIFNVKYSDWRP